MRPQRLEAAGRCEPVGLPVMVEPLAMKPGDAGYGVNGDADTVVTLVRQAAELGADVTKADPTDDLGEYGRVVEAAGRVPVLVRGGGRASDEEILRRTEAVLQQGAAGIVYGRNVVQHADPADDARADGDRARGRVRRGGARGPHRPCLTRSFASGSWVAGSWAASSPVPLRTVGAPRRPGVRPELAVVCDPNPDVLAWYERLIRAPRLVSDYRELLADDSVEAVYCAVPHHLHEEVYVACLRETPSG